MHRCAGTTAAIREHEQRGEQTVEHAGGDLADGTSEIGNGASTRSSISFV